MHCRRKWQPTPVFLPGESQGRGSLVGCHFWVAQSWTRLKQLSSKVIIWVYLQLLSQPLSSIHPKSLVFRAVNSGIQEKLVITFAVVSVHWSHLSV